MPELLAPAGSLEGVRAAVQSGANAVYMGFGTFNARRGAKNFSREEMAQAIAYCRARGVKTNITFNILALDRERKAAEQDIRFLNEAGADALIVQDLGMARLIRECAPDLPLHASTQMTIHTLDGAKVAKDLGFSRVVLSRECTLEQIQDITANAGVETEVFVHGALCMCYSGQCYLSAVIGQRSGNRGLCAQPCRLPYLYDGHRKETYALSLKDLCLAGWLQPLVQAGVASFKIEGRMKRPEYAAVVTDIYARLLREARKPTAEERETLRRVFSRDGFTDGYLTGKTGDSMFGTKTNVPLAEVKPLYDEAARRFAEGKEAPLVPVSLTLTVQESGLTLTARDADGHAVHAADAEPLQQAQNRPATAESVRKSLEKTGGTPFFVQDMQVNLADGLMIPASRLNALRRNALGQLLEERGKASVRRWCAKTPETPCQKTDFTGFVAMVRTQAQADALRNCGLQTIYAPLEVAAVQHGLQPVLPRVFRDDEQDKIENLLHICKENGADCTLIGNIGHIALVKRVGLELHGDFGLNAYNTLSLHALRDLGLTRQTLSFEARLAQLRDMDKPLDTMVLAYGYLPLMVFENCAIRRRTGKCSCKKGITHLTDRQGKRFALLPAYGCRNELLNSQPLSLSDKVREYQTVGAKYAMLRFTTEAPGQCREICEAFQMGRPLTGDITRGLYYRGVE